MIWETVNLKLIRNETPSLKRWATVFFSLQCFLLEIGNTTIKRATLKKFDHFNRYRKSCTVQTPLPLMKYDTVSCFHPS